ncbi:ribonuclease H-like domain-containing protein [Tanacetum coccineum]|uniref:Ribonuclease H-like domain-containing protein n=1 Tax=Tanacetum coccineum TaxID=301880 RepID=A0ABQ5F2E0_9ASTR
MWLCEQQLSIRLDEQENAPQEGMGEAKIQPIPVYLNSYVYILAPSHASSSASSNYQHSRHVRETITMTSTQNTDGIVQVEETSVSIRNGPAGIVQVEEVDEKLVRIIPGPADYMKQVVEDVGEDEDFNSGSWVGAIEYVKANGGIVSGCIGDIKTFLKNGKLEQVVAIIKSCSPNALGDLKVTVKDLSRTLTGSIHYKVITEGGYGKEITVGSAIILANVLVFSPNPSMHYLNITKKNVVRVFHKDFVPSNGSGVGGSGMLMEEEEIVKLVEEEEMADLELHVCWNVIDQEDLYKFDEEALDLVLEEKARESRSHEELLEKCRQQEEEDTEHGRHLLGFHGTI